jgi:predicted oxidoreductase (fatty acid repression mutant protein)
MADRYLADLKVRRTCYSLKSESPLSDSRIVEISHEVAKHTPSSFNCQSTRLVILLRDEHVEFWNLARQCFAATLQPAAYLEYEKKLLQRQQAYGTVRKYLIGLNEPY